MSIGGIRKISFHTQSAGALAASIKSGETSSVAVTQYFIDRIEKHNGALNAVIATRFDEALKDAAKADDAVAKGAPLGPLHGVPLLVTGNVRRTVSGP